MKYAELQNQDSRRRWDLTASLFGEPGGFIRAVLATIVKLTSGSQGLRGGPSVR